MEGMAADGWVAELGRGSGALAGGAPVGMKLALRRDACMPGCASMARLRLGCGLDCRLHSLSNSELRELAGTRAGWDADQASAISGQRERMEPATQLYELSDA